LWFACPSFRCNRVSAAMESAQLLSEPASRQLNAEAPASAARSDRRKAAVATALFVSATLLVVGLMAAHGGSSGVSVARDSPKSFMQADAEKKCTMGNDNCNVTQCCRSPGMQCYKQDDLYAQCRESCNPGPIPTHWDNKEWNCEALGHRTKGNVSCSADGENCLKTQCCKTSGTQCYKKNDVWAMCKSDCFPGAPDMMDDEGSPWSCEKLGPFTAGAQGWVWQDCAKDGENCAAKKCCLDGGMQCFSQGGPVSAPYWAQCKPSCTPGEKPQPWGPAWECGQIGSKTPAAPYKGGLMAKWAQEKCSKYGDDCSKSKCCLGMDAICYEKNSKYATCKTYCTPGKDPNDNNATWSCKELGPRSSGLAIKGNPSLFCISLTRTEGYEVDIMKGQLNFSIGIFACDETGLFSADGIMVLGKDKNGKEVSTVRVESAIIRTTMDGTAGNAKLFANMWDSVITDGRWRNHAWTVKVDPDAVIMPERVRWHVAQHTGEKVYVLNCNKVPGSPNFPMMFGSVEIFSFQAMEAFSTGKEECKAQMGQWLESWGEDYYMGKCMDLIHVGRINDFEVVGDSVCTGVDCNNPGTGAFHAFKSWGAWGLCHQQAVNATAKR